MSKTLTNIAGRTGLSDRVIRTGTEQRCERPGSPRKTPVGRVANQFLRFVSALDYWASSPECSRCWRRVPYRLGGITPMDS